MASTSEQIMVSARHNTLREYPLASVTCWAPPQPVSSRWSKVLEKAYRESTAWEPGFSLRRER